MTNTIEHISLSQLNSLVGEAIATQLKRSYWIVAEMVELNENYSGHCYLVLAEKEDDKVLAQSRAAIWQKTYRMVKPYFESTTGMAFAAGIKVRIKVSVSFHNVYGLNMTVQDIDPNYTVGEVTVKRKQIYNQLVADGVAQMNKELDLPVLPKRIAIISSPTAAGFEDFTNQLDNNPYNYKYHATLFSATMQGEGAEASVIDAMDRIYDNIDAFDVVVIIRGGGAALDLSCFDNYNIAFHLTQFPLPVFVGIGHERDETVLDLIAHSSFKTPTAVAATLIELMQQAESHVDTIMSRLETSVHQIVLQEKQHIYGITANLPMVTGSLFSKKKIHLNQQVHRVEQKLDGLLRDKKQYIHDAQLNVKSLTHDFFLLHKQRLEKGALVADLADPKHVLQRGYSITSVNGKLVKDISTLKAGDIIETVLKDGKVESTVN